MEEKMEGLSGAASDAAPGIEDRVDKVEKKMDDLAATNPSATPLDLTDVEKRLKDLEELVEERTNRQLRKTLVIRNVAESSSEKKWSDTKDVLVSKIAQVLDDVDEDEAHQMIDRCHRGKKWKKEKDGSDRSPRHRPIYAAMLYWEDCERIIRAARKAKLDFFVDYKYGPKTTARRNQALKKRKSLKEDGVIDQGYIRFPAVLFGKKSHETEYRFIEDFSSIDVDIKKD